MTTNTEQIMEHTELDRQVSYHDIAQEMSVSHQTVINHLQNAGYNIKLGVWVPNDLTRKELLVRVNACDMLLRRNELNPLLKRTVTRDKNCISYDNIMREWLWPKAGRLSQKVAEPELKAQNIILCVW